MEICPKVWFDGKVTSKDKVRLFPFFQGLNYGAAVYEGIRFYEIKDQPAIFRLDEHIERFFHSAETLRMKLGFTKQDLAAAIGETIRANKLKSGYIRPLAFYSENKMGINVFDSQVSCLIMVFPKKEKATDKKPIKVTISNYRRTNPDAINFKAKIAGYYANNLLGFIEAKEKGFDEAIFLDQHDHLTEGTVNNIFIIKTDCLYTPSTKNILPGITRDTILELAKDLNLKTEEGDYGSSFLKDADEVFLTGTGIELEKVASIDKLFTNKKVFPVTAKIQNYYSQVVHGQIEKYSPWLTASF